MDQREKHIAILVSFSGQGGVERVVNILSRAFMEKGVRVDLLLTRAKGEHFESIPAGVNILRLGVRHTFAALFPLVRYLKKEKPDALLAVKHRAVITATLGRVVSGYKGRLAGNIHTTVSASLQHSNPLKKFLYLKGMRFFYGFADLIIAVSDGAASDIARITGLPSDKIKALPNPVVTPEIFHQAERPVNHPWFLERKIPIVLGIGRLTKQKDFHTLLKAFQEVRKTRPLRLVVLGEGEDLESLRSLARELGIAEDVDFPGFHENPYSFLSRSALFVLSSRWEGFGIVLVEAMALGIPVVSTDCPNGPREILKDGRYGPLVPPENPTALAEAMNCILDHPPASRELETAAGDYTMEKIGDKYLALLLGKTPSEI